MKKDIKQIVDQVIFNNQEAIKGYTEDGNVYEYLFADYASDGQGHCFYLTESEIKDWETSEDKRNYLINEIDEFLEQFKDVNLN